MLRFVIGLLMLGTISIGVSSSDLNDPEIKLILATNRVNWVQMGLPPVNIKTCITPKEIGMFAWVRNDTDIKSINICDTTLLRFSIDELGVILLHESYHYLYQDFTKSELYNEYAADEYAYSIAKLLGISPNACNIWVTISGGVANMIEMSKYGDSSHPSTLTRFRKCREVL